MIKIIKSFYNLKEHFLPNGVFRRPRIWSNQELKKIASFFEGSVINVSGWKDSDKQDGFYRDYFKNASYYFISNYSGPSGFQEGILNQVFIDLEKSLPSELVGKFEVVFNHTTLEHVYNFQKAFENLTLLTNDILIVVLPFLQRLHSTKGDYQDYWRFSSEAVEEMMKKNNLKLIYLTANNRRNESVYLFAVGTKNPSKWVNKINFIDQSLFKQLGEKIIKTV
jgi:hypothetical protein